MSINRRFLQNPFTPPDGAGIWRCCGKTVKNIPNRFSIGVVIEYAGMKKSPFYSISLSYAI